MVRDPPGICFWREYEQRIDQKTKIMVQMRNTFIVRLHFLFGEPDERQFFSKKKDMFAMLIARYTSNANQFK